MVEQVKARKPAATPPEVTSPSLYINREVSYLEFFARVLAQACDMRHPLLERVRFLAIVSGLIDELFMVRVSDIQDELEGLVTLPPDATTPARQLAAIRKRVNELYAEQRRILCEILLPELADHGIRVVDLSELNTSQRAGLRTYFEREVYPILTPLAVDPGHPFPHISNLSVNLAVELAGEGNETRFARVKIPDVLPRLLHLEKILGQYVEGKKAKYTFVWLDQIVAANLSALFSGVTVLAAYGFRVIRDADIEIHEEEGVDLRLSVERSLRQRRFGEALMMAIEGSMPESTRAVLTAGLQLRPDQIYSAEHPLGIDSFMELTRVDRPDLKYPPHVPHIPVALAGGDPITSVIDRHDFMIQLPYDSFAPVLDLLQGSARDADVLAIKQTLYRVGSDAPVVRALLDAVNHGKQVAVLVELKARWDEASNIEWARELEQAGVHVAYGFFGLKTHAKVALVVRKTPEGIKRYVHLGTGNYNVSTARSYTDLGLFTSDPDFGADASDLFNFLTGYSQQTKYRRFLVAPVNLRGELLGRIRREIELHAVDGKGHLIFKMNSLIDKQFIRTLYEASQAGVKVELIVRGMCALRPGVPGVSENIRVVSLVGRFLEHSRAYWFRNGGDSELYLGSADLMPRNLDHRVEVLFPVLSADIREQVLENVLKAQLRDTVNAWDERSDGTYERVRVASGAEPFDSQGWNLNNAT
ncbi:MAG: polyphosphate kinase 1 [Gemmatimonadaceae bacterium]